MPRHFPDFDHFLAAARSADVIPVYRQLLADHLTPVTAFELLGQDEHAFLLESVVGNEKIGRYSFIATSPSLVYQIKDGAAQVQYAGGRTESLRSADPLADLQRLLPHRRYHRDRKLPAFTGGLVGYAGYDTIRYYEGESLPKPPADDRNLPDLLFGLYGELVVFDHVDKTVKVVANADLAVGTPREAYEHACQRVDDLVARLEQVARAAAPMQDIDTVGRLTREFASNMTQPQFEAAVRAAQEYIKAGDIFQVVPSQRLRVASSADPFTVYRALRVINPSPFMFYLKSPACTLIGASPEILCRVQDGIVTSRPLAGTRRRGATEQEDAEMERELLADPKERAEHIMLVDLHRNDVGRVAKIGSVKISDVMTVERYSHVMHITTNVTGELSAGNTALDALRVSLPVGTVSGAPKIRAMQIIDELETTRRGPYGGAVGYLDYAGNMDTCIALRTMVWTRSGTVPAAARGAVSPVDPPRSRDCPPLAATPATGIFDVQSGCGVVADSVPASEFEETMNKAKAMLKAVEIAEGGF